MAYTKIHAIKTTVDKSINYICNPDKTDEKMFISAFACSPETAAIDFKYTLDHCRENSPNKTYHLIQAFALGEVSYEEAHQIGIELADRLLQGKYSYIITTHIDKEHHHNHIIFCAADNIEHNKYHDCKQSYYHIRHLSDALCKEHDLSIILPSGERGKKYNEWQTDKTETSWKTQIRKDINTSIKSASTYEEFLLLMKAKSYEIKGEELGETAPKYISFRPLDKERFVRGSVKSLGKEYTKERIKERLELKQNHKKTLTKKDYTSQKLIDTSEEKFQNSIGLKRWATIENLKIATQNYIEIDSLSELEHEISLKTTAAKTAKQSVVKLEHQLKNLGEIIKYAEQYKTTRPYYLNYKKAKHPDTYFQKYESQLILYGGAKRMLEQSSIDLKTLNIEKLRTKYEELAKQKTELTSTYKTCEKDVRELNKKLKTLQQYFNQTPSSQIEQKQPKQEKNQIL